MICGALRLCGGAHRAALLRADVVVNDTRRRRHSLWCRGTTHVFAVLEVELVLWDQLGFLALQLAGVAATDIRGNAGQEREIRCEPVSLSCVGKRTRAQENLPCPRVERVVVLLEMPFGRRGRSR